MATKVMMPKLSDTMEEGKILKWLKKEGDKVKQGEILVEIESDKADMELEAYDSGVVRKLLLPEGGKAPIGQLIAIIAKPDEDISELLREKSPEATLREEPVAESKDVEAMVTEPARKASREPSVSAGDISAPKTEDRRVKASPLAKKMAQTHQLDLRSISGTGPTGRIIKRDIEQALKGGTVGLRAVVTGPPYEDVELSTMRKVIAKRMAESKSTSPHFYVTSEVDMEKAIAFRTDVNALESVKISYTDIIVKAVTQALLTHPRVNSHYLGDKIRTYRVSHIGVAVALEEGLITPIIRNCESKSLSQISAETKELVARARERRLKPEEYTGATFTISNLGMFDVENFAAIINPPEGAILAVSSILERPVVENGHIIAGHRMKLTLSCDHRVVDGAVGAKFLQDVKKLIENPLRLVSI